MKPEDLDEQAPAREALAEPFYQLLDRRKTPATYGLLAIIVGMFVVTELMGGSTATGVLIRAGANYYDGVRQGEWWRLFTGNFLHIGFVHLLVNGYSLFAVGPTLEKLFGTGKFLTLYLAAGLAGALASLAMNQGLLSAGASGALFGLLGALLVLGLRHHDAIPEHQRRTIRNLALVMVAINLGVGFVVPSIDNYAHMGGLLGGAIMAALLGPAPWLLGRRPRRWAAPLFVVAPAIAAYSLAVGLWYLASGQMPSTTYQGPGDDYELTLPAAVRAYSTARLAFFTLDGNVHHVRIHSLENPEGRPVGEKVPLAEPTLAFHAGALARRFLGEDERLVEPPLVVEKGYHHYLQLIVADAAGAREEIYLTASPSRLYEIRTRGLASEPWVRPTLERVLATFKMHPPQENPHGNARHHD